MVTAISSDQTFLIADEDNGTGRYLLLDIAVHTTGTYYIRSLKIGINTRIYTLTVTRIC